MSEWDDTNLARWLDAEAAGIPDEADHLFSGLVSVHLPRLQEPTGLADRVLAALPGRLLAPARPVFDPVSSWLVRLTTLAAVVLLGIGLALVSPRSVIALTAEMASVAARVLHDTIAALSAALGVWKASLDVLVALGQAAGVVFTTGAMPILITVNLAVASAAFLGLKHLLAPREEYL
jgi:hypothetical protein